MNIPSSVKTLAQRGLLLGRKWSPEILVGAGVVGVVTAAVLASRATLKLESRVDHTNAQLEAVRESVEAGDAPQSELTKVYARGVVDVVKLYAPSVSLGVLSIGCILGGHGILRRRNVAVMAAYKVLEDGYDKYRDRVISEFGEEKDEEFRRGIITEKIKDETTGKTKTVRRLDTDGLSPYARIFDEFNDNWEKVPESNIHFLKMVELHMNDKLRDRGHVFLNEVYDRLGFPRTEAGQAVGWVLNGDGDGYIDFGIYEPRNNQAINHGASRAENVYWLDFNVDGVVLGELR